jgi:hypothetical protein
MDFMTKILAQLFDSFKAKNPKVAAIIILVLGAFLWAAQNGLGEVSGVDFGKAMEWVVFVLAALQGSRTSQILHQDKETK